MQFINIWNFNKFSYCSYFFVIYAMFTLTGFDDTKPYDCETDLQVWKLKFHACIVWSKLSLLFHCASLTTRKYFYTGCSKSNSAVVHIIWIIKCTQERNQEFAKGGAWKWNIFVMLFWWHLFGDVIFTTSKNDDICGCLKFYCGIVNLRP